MTSEEYWRMFEAVRGDINAAVAASTAYLTIHNLAARDHEIAYKYNRTPDFWRVTTYALQNTFFIALGCIFDKRSDTFSIQEVVDAIIEHPGFFNKSALRKRKREASQIFGNQPDPEWLPNYLANA